MTRSYPSVRAWCTAALGITLWGVLGGAAAATDIVLRDGRVLSGKLGMVTGVAESPRAAAERTDAMPLVVLLDDDLRRTFVAKYQVREVKQDAGAVEVKEKFVIKQPTTWGGRQVKSVGPIIRVQPFDEFGRRTFTMNTDRGPMDIVQGITEITPEWTKVEAIRYIWDMRMATSSIPRDVLGKILMHQINPKDADQRTKIARFYIQSERYEDAQKELTGILADFPHDDAIKERLRPAMETLRRLSAQRMLSELKLRREAGQHRLVWGLLEKFPSEGVPGETLQVVREMIEGYQALITRRKAVLQKFDALAAKITDTYMLDQLRPIREEIGAELGVSTIDRMTAFAQNADDADMPPADRIALAVSGWLLGSDAAVTKLPTAVSAYRVRRAIRDYIREPIQLHRFRSLTAMNSEESATPELVAGLLAHMKPPLDTPLQDPAKPGYYELEVPGLPNHPAVHYLVQLPPEYDPYRRYPTIVTLNGSGTTAEIQLDWWAGAPGQGGLRAGQASRRGYIVVAPAWTFEHQKDYGYTAREHAAVLDSLRDACRRFSLDTDRVFLSGHSIGGDAAWDIGLAHPDLWAGVIPIVALSDRYCPLYWENAQLLPFYFVGGELDGTKMVTNARDFDRYFKSRYNITVVEYLGRGHEDFYDEVQRLFDWMGRFRRNFYPREFNCATMRHWDNFFWCVELNGMPSASMIDPGNWHPPRGTQPVRVHASLKANNTLYVQTSSATINVWLSPQLLDLSRKVSITINGRRLSTNELRPKIDVLMEDVRTRGDRQHPFWAKIDTSTGRLVE